MEILQNYFQQNKIKISNNYNQKFNVENNFFETIKIYLKDNNCFYYKGSDARIILSLIFIHIEFKVGVVLCNEINLDLNKVQHYKDLYYGKSKNNSFSIFTSGTTGKPKQVKINTLELISGIKKTKDRNINWLLTYNPKSYAGLQVILTAFISNNKLYTIDGNNNINKLFKIIKCEEINAISATPTFWKIFLSSDLKKDTILKIITLGGEIIEENLLLTLLKYFPKAKITQIYATTEFGRLFSVIDNKPGFPIGYLKDYNLKIIDDTLHVKVNSLYLSTNDKVEIQNNRVLFSGRNTDFVKIAGNKINLKFIEEKISNFSCVVDVSISTKSSPITDIVIKAEVVLKKNTDSSQLEFKKLLKENLETYEIPKLIKFVDKIKLNSNLKKIK